MEKERNLHSAQPSAKRDDLSGENWMIHIDQQLNTGKNQDVQDLKIKSNDVESPNFDPKLPEYIDFDSVSSIQNTLSSLTESLSQKQQIRLKDIVDPSYEEETRWYHFLGFGGSFPATTIDGQIKITSGAKVGHYRYMILEPNQTPEDEIITGIKFETVITDYRTKEKKYFIRFRDHNGYGVASISTYDLWVFKYFKNLYLKND